VRASKKRIVLGVLLALAALIVLLNWTWGRLPGEPERSGRMVQVGDAQVRVLERPGSDAVRAPVVLIHGLPGTAGDFEDVTPLLRGLRTIAYDRPGFGFSSGGYHAFAEQLTTLHRLLARLGAERPVLVGHSYGGTIALAYAARYPEDVRGLVLVDAAAAGQDSSAVERGQARLIQFLSWPVVEPLADVTFSQLLRTVSAKQGDAAAFDPDAVDERHEQRLLAMNMRHEDLDAFASEVLESEDVIADLDRRLATIATPAVVIQGADDKLVEPERGRAIAARLPNARLVMVSGGHMPTYLHPARVAAAVRELSVTGDEPARGERRIPATRRARAATQR
jgi:pimeloyl-ACP methyl ester carboxylesterase